LYRVIRRWPHLLWLGFSLGGIAIAYLIDQRFFLMAIAAFAIGVF
jgi:hypothetical protein